MKIEQDCYGESSDYRIISKLKNNGKKSLIYGNANHAQLVYAYLESFGVEVDAFVVDEQYFQKNTYLCGKKVEKLEDYLERIAEYNFVIGFCDVDKSKFIMNNQHLLKGEFFLLWEPLEIYHWDREFFDNNREIWEEIYYSLADDFSRKILSTLIEAKLNYDGSQLLKISDGKQYFNELTFTFEPEKEIFVDCGAFIGDTILKYKDFTSGRYKKIYAFEPNESNVEQLYQNTQDMLNVEIVSKGTWSSEAELRFCENGSASLIDDAGNISVPVTTIDKVVGNDMVTFIKMDVEGSELESLHGAENTIKHCMPKLAICCYHKENDIPNFYLYLKSFNGINGKKYQFYIRHHSNGAYETVFYAIPVSC